MCTRISGLVLVLCQRSFAKVIVLSYPGRGLSRVGRAAIKK
jgi:hypothetical protein